MQEKRLYFTFVLLIFVSGLAFASGQDIQSRLDVLAQHEFSDPRIESLNKRQRKLFTHLIKAAQLIDQIYLQQLHPGNVGWIEALKKAAKENPSGDEALYLDYFKISHGPWDVFSGDWILPKKQFAEVQPLVGKNVYPISTEKNASISRATLEAWIKKNPGQEKSFKSNYTVIQGNAKDGFTSTTYATFYRKEMQAIAHHLKAASKYTRDKTLKQVLTTRAHAFANNEFDQTEPTWIQAADTDVQVMFGPYEEYIDGIWSIKRAFGARVGFKDIKATKDMEQYKKLGKKFQANLPIDAKYYPDQRKEPFFTIWRQVFTSGDARNGAQTLGQKLPNDRSITIKHGARQSMFANSFDGKCEKILKPISKIVLIAELQKHVTCDSFIKATLHHEYAHALGPAFAYENYDKPDAKTRKEFNEVLVEWGSPLEELKADILGIYDRQYMFDQGLEDRSKQIEMYATWLAGFFRSVRFGGDSPYRKGAMVQLNWLLEKGVVAFDRKNQGRVQIKDLKKFPQAIASLTQKVLMLQVEGSDADVAVFYKKYGPIASKTQRLIDRVNAQGIPKDLYPIFPIVEKLGLSH